MQWTRCGEVNGNRSVGMTDRCLGEPEKMMGLFDVVLCQSCRGRAGTKVRRREMRPAALSGEVGWVGEARPRRRGRELGKDLVHEKQGRSKGGEVAGGALCRSLLWGV